MPARKEGIKIQKGKKKVNMLRRRRREEEEAHTEEGTQGSQDLSGNGLPFAEAGLDQDGKVTNLVGNLVEEDSHCGRDAKLIAGREGGGDGHAVSEVVGGVGNQVEEAANELLRLHSSILLSVLLMLMLAVGNFLCRCWSGGALSLLGFLRVVLLFSLSPKMREKKEENTGSKDTFLVSALGAEWERE